MPVAIKNLTARSLFVPLNSGTNLRLSSGEVAGPVPDVELKNNSKIDKLIAQRAIAVEPQAKEAVEAHSTKPAPHAREKRGATTDPSDQVAAPSGESHHPHA